MHLFDAPPASGDNWVILGTYHTQDYPVNSMDSFLWSISGRAFAPLVGGLI